MQTAPGTPGSTSTSSSGAKAHPALRLQYVRQALIRASTARRSRGRCTQDGLVRSAKDLPVLQSHIYKPFEKAYYKRRTEVGVQPDEGHQHAEEARVAPAGPTSRRASNNEHLLLPERRQAVVPLHDDAGNQLRALTFEIIQKQLKSVGIELTAAVQLAGPSVRRQNAPVRRLGSVLFTWVGGPSSSATSQHLRLRWRPELQELLQHEGTRHLQGAGHRSTPLSGRSCSTRPRRSWSKDMPSIPLFVRPTLRDQRRRSRASLINPTQEGTPWNVRDLEAPRRRRITPTCQARPDEFQTRLRRRRGRDFVLRSGDVGPC